MDDSFYLCTSFVRPSDFVQSPLLKSITIWQSISPTSLSYLFTEQYSTETPEFTNVSYSFQTFRYMPVLIHQQIFHNIA